MKNWQQTQLLDMMLWTFWAKWFSPVSPVSAHPLQATRPCSSARLCGHLLHREMSIKKPFQMFHGPQCLGPCGSTFVQRREKQSPPLSHVNNISLPMRLRSRRSVLHSMMSFAAKRAKRTAHLLTTWTAAKSPQS